MLLWHGDARPSAPSFKATDSSEEVRERSCDRRPTPLRLIQINTQPLPDH